MRIACPPEPLVALRTICRCGKEISPLSPLYAALQHIYFRHGAYERSYLPHIVVQNYTLNPVRVRLRILGKSRQLHISKSMIGKQRIPLLYAKPLAYIGILRARRTVIFRIQCSVFFQHLRNAHRYLPAGRRRYFYPRPANHILTEVEYIRTRLYLMH